MSALRRALPALLLLAAGALSSCASYFKLEVHAPVPRDIGSVFVLFGAEKHFATLAKGQSAAQVSELVQPKVLEDPEVYPCYVESELDEAGHWRDLSERPSKDIKRLDVAKEPGVLRFSFNRKYLERVPDLALCVIVRSNRNEFSVRRWTPQELANLEEPLALDVLADEPAREHR